MTLTFTPASHILVVKVCLKEWQLKCGSNTSAFSSFNNSLASVHPELIPEWSERNLPLTPDKITFGSNKRVWWKGACGHEWETSVKARSKGEKCPICSGARVIEGMLGFVKEAFLMEKERQELLDLHCEATVDGYTDFIFINRFGQPQHQATLNKAIRRIIRDCNDEQLLIV